jgi:hypothetical protein
MAEPVSTFEISIHNPILTIEGEPIQEPFEGGLRTATLGHALANALLSDAKPADVTLTLLDRLILARRFRGEKEPKIKVETALQLRKIVAEAYRNSPLVGGQVLEYLGEEPSENL